MLAAALLLLSALSDNDGACPTARVEPNGGGEGEEVLQLTREGCTRGVVGADGAETAESQSDWRRSLLAAYPNASRITLKDADGFFVAEAWHECLDDSARCMDRVADDGGCSDEAVQERCYFSCGRCGDKQDKVSSKGELPSDEKAVYAMVDGFPFVWPAASRSNVLVDYDGDVERTVPLNLLSAKPRIFEAEGIASAEECAAIRRLAEPKMQASVVNEGRRSSQHRNSASGFLGLDAVDSRTKEGADEKMLRRVWQRLAALVRTDPRSAEMMQVNKYDEGQHYFHHLDNGGQKVFASVAGRAITVLLYLNDGFEGGETSFPLAGDPRQMVAQSHVDAAFGSGCQTDKGLTVRPKMGSAVVFYPVQPNTAEPDLRTWHASCDVRGGGSKWVANLWFNLGLEEQKRQEYFARHGGNKVGRPFYRRPGRPVYGPKVVEDGKPVGYQRDAMQGGAD